MKVCGKEFERKLKNINRGLFCRWNGRYNKWQIYHKDDRTALIRRVRYLQTANGDYLDYTDSRVEKILFDIKNNTPWDMLARFDTTDEIMDELDRKQEAHDQRMEAERNDRNQEIIRDTMREEKTWFFQGA